MYFLVVISMGLGALPQKFDKNIIVIKHYFRHILDNIRCL